MESERNDIESGIEMEDERKEIEINRAKARAGWSTRAGSRKRAREVRDGTILDLARSSDRHRGSASGPLSSTDPRATD